MLGIVLAIAVASVAFAISQRGQKSDRAYMTVGFATHIVASFAIVVYHEYVFKAGDMLEYRDIAREIARLLEVDPRYWTDVFRLGLRLENDLRVDIVFTGSSATMVALMATCVTLLGDNLYAICVLVSMFSYFGQIALYRGVAMHLEPHERKPFLISLMVLPSVTFWSSGFIKEAFVMGFLGFALWGLLAIGARKRLGLGVVATFFGLGGIALFKPYVLFPLMAASGAWVYARGSGKRKLSLAFKLFSVVVAILGVVAMSVIFPEFSVSHLGETMAQQQRGYAEIEGGSNVDIGAMEDPSLASQLRFLPLAIINSLFRPFIFEVRNVSQAIVSIEMTVVTCLALAMLLRGNLRRSVAAVQERPPLAFAAVFTFTFTSLVGLATANLGTLSRYRIPAMPMYVALLLVLDARSRRILREEIAARVQKRVPLHRALPPRDQVPRDTT